MGFWSTYWEDYDWTGRITVNFIDISDELYANFSVL